MGMNENGSKPGGNGKGETGLKVLVTGAAGFIGSHLCERLLDRGHHVWGLDNFDPFYSPRIKRANIRAAAEDPRMHFVEGDLRDQVLLGGLLADVRFDTVVHLAARPGVRPSIEDPGLCFDVNVMGTLSLLEAMRRYQVPALVYGSSSSVYGKSRQVPFEESEAADRPVSQYAASKRAAELLCHTYHDLYGMSVYCLRFFTVFGPRQRPDLAIHKFARLMSDGQPLPLYGDGTSARDYTYVDDTVEGIERAMLRLERDRKKGPVYEIINLGRSEPTTLDELVSTLSDAMGMQPRIERMPDQPGDVPLTCASTRKSKELLDFAPDLDLSTGLRRFVEWYRETREEEASAAASGTGSAAG